MNLRETLQLAWKNREQIREGFYNLYLSHNTEVKEEATRRKTICESNVCGLYDKEGKPETSAIPGTPTCSGCHCNISAKTSCMKCWCTLGDGGESGSRKTMDKALWVELIDEQMDKEIGQKQWEEQFKPKIN